MIETTEHKEGTEIRYYQRLTKNEVMQHNIMWVSFVTLVATGFMSQIPHEWVEAWFGPYRDMIFTIRGYVHRTFGLILAGVSIWHLFYVTMTKDGRGAFKALMPVWKDLGDMGGNIRFMLGRQKHRPKFARFDYREKMEYIFGALGTAIITITGFVLFFSEYFDKFVIDISTVIHRMEAILATMSISIWHFYAVHFKPGKFPFSTIFLDGKMEMHELEEEHILVYEQIMQGSEHKSAPEAGTEG